MKVLGHGSSGLVEKAIHDSSGIIIGIKVIQFSNLKGNDMYFQ